MTLRKRAAAVVVLTMLLLPAMGGIALAQFSVPPGSGVTIGPGPASCNGLLPTPGSENTIKTLTGGSLVPGGTAEYLIRYPVDPSDEGQTFVVGDCVLIGNGSDLKKYDVLDKASFTGVANNQFFEVAFTVTIPMDTPLGSTICNIAKTTAAPSASPSSNRKAGPACFTVGGGARVEKHSVQNPDGPTLAGAVFRISDCVNTAVNPAFQPIIVTVSSGTPGIQVAPGDTVDVTAENGYIAFNGASGSSCRVTEITPPPGYGLPADPADLTLIVTIPVGEEQAVFTFLDPQLAPGVQVTKTCSGPVLVGDDVQYSITILNTGTEGLTDLQVDDSLLGDLTSSFPSTLGVGVEVTRQFSHTVTADDPDPLPNRVTVTASGVQTEGEVSDTARCESDVVHEPKIKVEKTCQGTALVGEEVTYTIKVTNTGGDVLEDVTVVDALLGDISDLFSDTLAVGESETHTVTRVVQPGEDPVVNVVTATAIGADSRDTVASSDTCTSDVLLPGIKIVKSGPALAHVGDTITYTFAVTNTGETPLEGVSITDPLCDPGTLSSFTGDLNDNGLLDLEEAWLASCTHRVTASDGDPLPNTAVVDASDEQGNPVSDEDSHVVDIIHPSILVVKTASSVGGSPGDEITYTYVVLNTGDTTLFDVSVDDDKLGHIGDIESLEAGESVTLTKTTKLPNDAGALTNVVVARGTDELGKAVSDDDEVTVTVVLGQPPIVLPPPPVEEMPETGTDLGAFGSTGLWFLFGGLGMVVAARVRRPRAASGTVGMRFAASSPIFGATSTPSGRSGHRVDRKRARDGTGRDPDHGPPRRSGS